MMEREFIAATRDYAGLGFAIRLQDEGHDVVLATNPDEETIRDPERLRAFNLVGNGMIPKASLAESMDERENRRDWYWVWDANHSVAENELFRAGGFRVLGGGGYADRMEHDRAACLEFTSVHGLNAPPTFPFSGAEGEEASLRPVLRSVAAGFWH